MELKADTQTKIKDEMKKVDIIAIIETNENVKVTEEQAKKLKELQAWYSYWSLLAPGDATDTSFKTQVEDILNG